MIFLEVWKRRQYKLTYKWGSDEENDTSDNCLSSYRETAGDNHKYNPAKLKYELHVKARRRRAGWTASLVTVLFFILLVGVATFRKDKTRNDKSLK